MDGGEKKNCDKCGKSACRCSDKTEGHAGDGGSGVVDDRGSSGGDVGGGEVKHELCECGAHCSCNPCTCGKTDTPGLQEARAACMCGPACTCPACAPGRLRVSAL